MFLNVYKCIQACINISFIILVIDFFLSEILQVWNNQELELHINF